MSNDENILVQCGRADSALHKWLHDGPGIPLSTERVFALNNAVDSKIGQLISARLADAGAQSFVMKTPPLLQLIFYGCGCSDCLKHTEKKQRTHWTSEEIVILFALLTGTDAFTGRDNAPLKFNKKLVAAALMAMPAVQMRCVSQMQIQTAEVWQPFRDAIQSADSAELVAFARATNMCGSDATRMTLSMIGSLENAVWSMLIVSAVLDKRLEESLATTKIIHSSLDLVCPLSEWLPEAMNASTLWYRTAHDVMTRSMCDRAPDSAGKKTRKFKQWPTVCLPARAPLWKEATACLHADDYVHPAVAVNSLVALYYFSLLSECAPSKEAPVPRCFTENQDTEAVPADQ